MSPFAYNKKSYRSATSANVVDRRHYCKMTIFSIT
ncbi:fibronectin type II domain-containing protein [Bradyrhizobium sp. 190]